MTKNIILILVLALINLPEALAQNAPWWYNNPPSSSSGKYCYISVLLSDGEDVLKKALPKAVSCGGLSYNPGGTYSEVGNGRIEIGGKVIRYQRVDSKASKYGGEYVLMMFTKEEIKAKKKLPKGPTHLPLSLLFSSVIPGTGQFYKQESGKGWLFLGATLAFGGTSYYFETQRKSKLDEYESASTFEQREQLITDIENNRNYRNIAAAAAGAFYLVNIVDAVASKGRRFAYNPERRVNWNLGYLPVNGGTASARLNFKMGM